jgi:uncharacterized protein YggT (Ycf19 family)
MAALDVASASRLTRSRMINVPSAWVREQIGKFVDNIFSKATKPFQKKTPYSCYGA